MTWWMFYAALTAATIVVVSAACGHEHLTLTGLPIAVAVLLTTFLLSLLSFEAAGVNHRAAFPLIDLGAGSFFAFQWRTNLKWWSLALAVLFVAEMAQHAVYYALPNHGYMSRYSYDLYLNVNYVLQLACVAFPSLQIILVRRAAATLE